MIEIILNGKKTMVNTNSTLQEALQEWGYQTNYFAVAINKTFVPRAKYAVTKIDAQDCIEIVAPMQGG